MILRNLVAYTKNTVLKCNILFHDLTRLSMHAFWSYCILQKERVTVVIFEDYYIVKSMSMNCSKTVFDQNVFMQYFSTYFRYNKIYEVIFYHLCFTIKFKHSKYLLKFYFF